MHNKTQCDTLAGRPASRAIPLGAARHLTRASFSGIRAELVSNRQYTLGA